MCYNKIRRQKMILLLVVIYITFISLGLPDSLFGVAWPLAHVDFGLQESFGSIYSVIIALCTGGVSFFAGPLIKKFGTKGLAFLVALHDVQLLLLYAWIGCCTFHHIRLRLPLRKQSSFLLHRGILRGRIRRGAWYI